MTFRATWLACAILAVVAATTASAQNAPPPVTVAKPVVRDVVDNDEFIGRFDAVEQVTVRARVGGYLQQVNFVDGSLVKEGDLLFIIDQRPFVIALDQADAQLDAAKATEANAVLQLKRAQDLATSGAQSASILDDRRRDWQSAAATVRAAQAAADRAALDLEYTKIRAPIAGRIDRKRVTEGNLVQADQTVLTTIVSLDPIDFYFDVDERRLLNFAQTAQHKGADLQLGSGGIEARVSVIDSSLKPFVGKLDFAENRVDAATGTLRMRARFANPDLLLQPGLFGRISVEASNTYRAVLVPDEAVGSDQNERVVYAVADDGTVASKPVRLGPRLYGYRVVRSGLTGNETLVINGLMRVRPGAKVTPNRVDLPPSRDDLPPEAGGLEMAP